jgi:hypothetical protein
VEARVDRLSETQLLVTLDRLKLQLDELKNRQFAGRSNIVNHNNFTGGVDLSGIAFAAYTQKRWRVTFTPDTAKSAYAELAYWWFLSGANGLETIEYYPDPDNSTEDAFRSWIFVVTSNANAVTLDAWFLVKCVDTGTITWSLL